MRNFKNFDERVSYYRREMMRYAPAPGRPAVSSKPAVMPPAVNSQKLEWLGNDTDPCAMAGVPERFAQLHRGLLPRRVLFGKGVGVFGTFTANGAASDWTSAGFLRAETRTKVLVRFSLMSGTEGSADSIRDFRGFAVKFYTPQGNCDLICESLMVFWLRNMKHLPELAMALVPPQEECGRKRERFWKLVSENQEMLPATTLLYSDLGTQKSYRTMDAWSILPQLWTAPNGSRRYVRCHWKAKETASPVNQEEALLLSGVDPNAAVRDLQEAVREGNFPKYELFAQALPEGCTEIDPMDLTAAWPEAAAPWKKIGELVLDQNPVDSFEQVERAAFHPGHVVPGIGLPEDQAVLELCTCCSEAQRYRLGPDYHNIPINRQQTGGEGNLPAHSTGSMKSSAPLPAPDDLGQARQFWESFDMVDRRHLAQNMALELKYIDQGLCKKILGLLERVAPEYREEVEKALSE